MYVCGTCWIFGMKPRWVNHIYHLANRWFTHVDWRWTSTLCQHGQQNVQLSMKKYFYDWRGKRLLIVSTCFILHTHQVTNSTGWKSCDLMSNVIHCLSDLCYFFTFLTSPLKPQGVWSLNFGYVAPVIKGYQKYQDIYGFITKLLFMYVYRFKFPV